MSRQAQLLLLWVLSSFGGALMALQFSDAAFEEQTRTWVPVGNDSFYHARRIIDAATTDNGLNEFDTKIHVPQGSWITWPWGYDWAMAQALKGWVKLNPNSQPMAFLAQVPVFWVFVNAALLIGICIYLQLAIPWTALVMFGYAASPLTMLLHGVGIIDHHFIEYTFVLATILAGLKYLTQPEKLSGAILLGLILGIAPAFHTGLFVLQAPVLLTLGLLWLRNNKPPDNTLAALSTALILSTVAAVLPSEPFRDGQFQFSVLSWFHLYIASVSTLVITCIARFKCSPKTIIGLLTVGLLLLIPIWQDTLGGAAFLSGDIKLLDKIAEAQSPFMLAAKPGGRLDMLAYYSLFGILAPLLIPLYLWYGWRTQDRAKQFLAVMIVFGTTLMLTQFRLHYFGSFAIVLGLAVIANDQLMTKNSRFWGITITAWLMMLVSLFFAYSVKVDTRYPLALDPAYDDSYPLILEAKKVCAANPGIILSDNNFGHYLRYDTECSVIANNFLMTPLHENKVREMEYLFSLSPEELLDNAPAGLHYIFSRLDQIYGIKNGEYVVSSNQLLQDVNSPLDYALNSRQTLPRRYKIISELPLDEARGLTRARLIEILPE